SRRLGGRGRIGDSVLWNLGVGLRRDAKAWQSSPAPRPELRRPKGGRRGKASVAPVRAGGGDRSRGVRGGRRAGAGRRRRRPERRGLGGPSDVREPLLRGGHGVRDRRVRLVV